jgi:hypothetical protein
MMGNGISLLGGQIVIPAYITLPLPVVIVGALLALVGAITLFCLYMASQVA